MIHSTRRLVEIAAIGKKRDILTNFFLNIADRTEKSGSAVIGRAGSWFIVRLSDSPYMELSW